jgi:hypothetical protein
MWGHNSICYVVRNQKQGIIYGWNKDYDNLGCEEAVIDLLHNGLNSKYAKKYMVPEGSGKSFN